MAFGITYAPYPTIPKGNDGSLLDLVNSFESGFGKGRGIRNDREGLSTAYDLMGQGGQQETATLSSLGGQGRQSVGEVQRSSLSAPVDYPSYRVEQAHGDMSKNNVFGQFMGTLKNNGLTNPYGLAAVASTGQHESAFSPENANRTWNDGANNAGGILSWNGPRLTNLEAYARTRGEQGLGSPRTQAEFFLREDPELVQRLQGARSAEEAQQIINGAWRYKGYDRPGGETADRIASAQGFVSQFGGEGGQGGNASAPVSGQQQGQGGSLTQLAQGALGAPNVPQPTREQFMALMRSDITRPLGKAIFQARTSGDQNAAKNALDIAMQLDERQREIQQQRFDNDLAERKFQASQQGGGYTLSPGQVRYDARGNAIARGGPESGAPTVQTFYDENGQQYKAQWNPDTGEWDQVGGSKLPSGTKLSVGPNGEVQFQQGGNLTETQSKDTVFSTRAAGALPIVDEFGDALTSLPQSVGSQTPLVGNYMTSEEYQRANQAGREFLLAILRKDTGAAIRAEEEKQYGEVYLPMPGDKPATLTQKKAARARALEALKMGLPAQSILALEKAGYNLPATGGNDAQNLAPEAGNQTEEDPLGIR